MVSAGYFSDLIKKKKNDAGVYSIKSDRPAKDKIFDHSKSVSKIAFERGFKYLQNLQGCLNKGCAQSPNEYRMLN